MRKLALIIGSIGLLMINAGLFIQVLQLNNEYKKEKEENIICNQQNEEFSQYYYDEETTENYVVPEV